MNENTARMIIAAQKNPTLITILADAMEDEALVDENGNYLSEYYRGPIWAIRERDYKEAKEVLFCTTAEKLKATSIEDLCLKLHENRNDKDFISYMYETFFPSGVLGLHMRNFTKQQIAIYYFIRGISGFSNFRRNIYYGSKCQKTLYKNLFYVLEIIKEYDEDMIRLEIDVFRQYLKALK